MSKLNAFARRLCLAGAMLSVAPSLLTGCAPRAVVLTDADLDRHRITVAGVGEASARPDIARAHLGIEVMAPTVGEATRTANARMAAILDALKRAGVPEKDIRTSNFSINFERPPMPEPYYGYGAPMMPGMPGMPGVMPGQPAPGMPGMPFASGMAADMAAPPEAAVAPAPAPAPKAAPAPKSAPAPKGAPAQRAAPAAPTPPMAMPMPPPVPAMPAGFYRVSNTVEVTVRDLDKVGPVLDAAIGAGANSVHGVQFSLEHPEALEAKAREKAVANAKARAEALARLSGVQLAGVVKITEGASGGGMPPPMPQMMAASARDMSFSTPIAPGEINLTMQLEVVYALEPREGGED